MERNITLRDGTSAVIRPIRPSDIELSHDFFTGLDPADRRYLRRDVTRRDVVEDRIEETRGGLVDRVVAIIDDHIVADGSLERDRLDWAEPVAEIRLIVSRPWRRFGLGTLMARELYTLANRHQVDRMKARVMRPQKAARQIFRRLGFHEEFLIPDEVRDRDGVWQDLIVMRCDLATLWNELEHMLQESDWRRHR